METWKLPYDVGFRDITPVMENQIDNQVENDWKLVNVVLCFRRTPRTL